jgi:hypothetical protein
MTYEEELEALKERLLKQQMPFLRKISVDCIKCGETMFTLDKEEAFIGPISMICEKCRRIKNEKI